MGTTSKQPLRQRVAIVGGGAAGFFAAINLKEMAPTAEVTIFEKGTKVLGKVEISGGGRCNCTNSFAQVSDLSQVYPRGHRLLKRLFNNFDQQDAYQWFEQRGVKLTTQDDECVFPQSQDSHSIIHLFLSEARRHGIVVKTQQKIASLDQLADYHYIVVTTGGSPRQEGLTWLQHETASPVPSLFTFNIADKDLQALMGTVVENVSVSIPGSKLRAAGPLLITHWGMSGPSILRLSSYAARELANHNYQLPLSVNWTSNNEAEVRSELDGIIAEHAKRSVQTIRPFALPARLWNYLSSKCLGQRATYRWQDINPKEKNRLVNLLTNDQYQIAGRAVFKDEFVTCGGISLSAVNSQTLESKTHPHLYFAGEVLDIDGVTGGFNFQAAWTTAYTVAMAISNSINKPLPTQ
jgi:predicted Rossmann fold flavoprotein